MDPPDLLAPDNFLTEITDLQLGVHFCWIYKTSQEHRGSLTPYIKQKLAESQKTTCIVDQNTANEILAYLHETDCYPEPCLGNVQLLPLTGYQSCLEGGTSNPDAMTNLLEKGTEKVLAEGRDVLRVTGAMTSVLRGRPDPERLMEYESKLNHLFPEHHAPGLCQYDRTGFD